MKLKQKQFLKGSREFEIVDDVVNVRIKSGLKEEKLTVVLSVINPEPVIEGSMLVFRSRVRPCELLSLFLDKPNSKEFNAFVDTLKRRAKEEYSAFAGFPSSAKQEAPGDNTYDEPPEFDEPDSAETKSKRKPVNPERVGEAIQLLKQYLDTDEIKPLLSSLEALQQEPKNESRLVDVENAFSELGITQGAVLTYAPYISILLSENPY